MRSNRRSSTPRSNSTRQGVAAVETAFVFPLFVLLVLGAVDAGQFANCHQKISDACREGARHAVRFETTDVADVEAAVMACLGDMFPHVSAATLDSGATVVVRNLFGATITGSGLGSVASGNPVEVEVTFQFSSVRWMNWLPFLNGRTVQAVTTMRRE